LALCVAVGLPTRSQAVANISIGPGTEFVPVVVANPGNGQFLVVWHDASESPAIASGSYEQVLGRRIDAAGKPLGEVFLASRRVQDSPALGGSRPAVAYSSKLDEFLIVYDRNYDGSGENGILGIRIAADGKAVTGEEIALVAGAFQANARIAYDPGADRYLLVWTSSQGVLGRFLDGQGAPLTGAALFAPAGAASPALAFSADSNRYLLVYQSPGSDGSDIAGQIIDADGQPIGDPFAIATAAGEQSTPAVTLNSKARQFVVAWTDRRHLFVPAAASAQAVFGTGDLSGSNVKLADAALAPRLGYSPVTGKYLLAWMVNDPASSKAGFVRGRVLNPNLKPVGRAFFVSEAAAGRPFVVANPGSANAYVVWTGEAEGQSAVLGSLQPVARPKGKLTLTMKAKPARAGSGDKVQFELSILNQGNAVAKSAVLKDELPVKLSLESAVSDLGSCVAEANVAQCDLGDIGPGSGAAITLTAVVAGAGRIVNAATLTWTVGAGKTAQVSARARVKALPPG
jgi:hypothetical protein